MFIIFIYYLPYFFLEHLLDITFSVFTFYLLSLRQDHEDLRKSRRIGSSSETATNKMYNFDRTKMQREERRRMRNELKKREQDRDRSLRGREDILEQEQAARKLRLAAKGLPQDDIAEDDFDKIIKEPLGGAHYDREEAFASVQAEILKTFKVLDKLSPEELIEQRRQKFDEMGVFNS